MHCGLKYTAAMINKRINYFQCKGKKSQVSDSSFFRSSDSNVNLISVFKIVYYKTVFSGFLTPL